MPEPWEPGPWDEPWPGPGRLPVDPDAEWLAALPDADVVAPWTGAGEVLGAGFEHRAGGVSGFGFAAGGALDLMEPGPVLAGFLADALAGGVPGGASSPAGRPASAG